MNLFRKTIFLCIALLLSFNLLGLGGLLPQAEAEAAGGMPIQISAGGNSVVLKQDGSVWSWGVVPTRQQGLSHASNVSSGLNHSLAVQDGQVWAWGANNYGQLGIGEETYGGQTHPFLVRGIADVATVHAANYFSLALKRDGTVWGWGGNGSGQLGSERTCTICATPAPIPNLHDVVAVSGGIAHGIALKADGTVWVWGHNGHGQFGDGTRTSSPVPKAVPGLADVKAIDAGTYFNLALKADGTVWAWGNNQDGQLGNGTTSPFVLTPAQVGSLGPVDKISAFGNSSMALQSDGTLMTWGDNTNGVLGNGTETDRPLPGPVSNLAHVVDAAAGGGHMTAVTSDGTVWSWGHWQKLGANFGASQFAPTRVWGFDVDPILALTSATGTSVDLQFGVAGAAEKYVLKRGEETIYQGLGQTYHDAAESIHSSGLTPGKTYEYTLEVYGGQSRLLGTKTLAVTTPPLAIALRAVPLSKTSVSIYYRYQGAGSADRYVLKKEDGTVIDPAPFGGYTESGLTPHTTYTYAVEAYDSGGQLLAADTVAVKTSPVKISSNHGNTLVLKEDGTVWAWGANTNGELGQGVTFTHSTSPVQVQGLDRVVDISAGYNHELAVKSDGTVWAWGNNFTGALGITTSYFQQATPIQVPNVTDVKAVAGGDGFSLALKKDGTVWAWGGNSDGRLGDGTKSYISGPVQVAGLENVTAIASQWAHSFALKADGTVWGWGNNADGQLGGSDPVLVPRQMAGLTDVIAIEAGGRHSLFLKADGTLWGLGRNDDGPVGVWMEQRQRTPVKVMDDVVGMAAGQFHSVAVKRDGSVWAWGENRSGEVGDLTLTSRFVPVRVGSVVTNAVAVAAGSGHSAVVRGDGSICSWGAGHLLGTGSTDYKPADRYTCTEVVDFGNPAPAEDTDVTPEVHLTVSGTALDSYNAELTYSADGEVDHYVIKRDDVTIAAPAPNGSYTDRRLTPNTTYTYTVEAYAADGTLLDMETVTVTTPPLTITATGQALDADTAELTYRANGEVAAYVIKRDGAVLASPAPNGTYAENGLLPGATYTYVIEAYDANGHLLGSVTVTVTMPAFELILTATPLDKKTIRLDYTPNGDVANYILKRDGQVIAQGPNPTYTDTGLNKNKQYTYTVEAYDSQGNLLGSDTVVASPGFTLEVTAVQTSDSAVDLTFVGIGATVGHYEVFHGNELICSGDLNAFTDSGLTPGEKVKYTVIAYDPNGKMLGRVIVRVTVR